MSKIWQEINYTFADAERYNSVNVDSLYQAYLPLIEEVENEYEYFQLLSSFLANFREGHTRIIPPVPTPYDYPKLDIERLDDIIYVSDCSEKLSNEVPRFSKILKVNGIEANKYLNDSVVPYVSASTERWRLDKAAMQLLYGEPNTNVVVTLQTPEGDVKELTLTRNAQSNDSPMLHALPTMEFNWVNDSILRMDFNTCMDVEGARQIFLSHLNDLNVAKGIIIDMRRNRGGSEESWYLPLFLMINKDDIASKGYTIKRSSIALDDTLKPSFCNGTYEVEKPLYNLKNGIPEEYRVDTPLVILSGKYTGSAAEFFVELMRDNHPNLTIIGEPSVGSSSIPKFVALPGDYTLMIAQEVCCDAEGSIIGHTGVIPDETIYMTYEDLINDRDPILERAIELLTI